MSYEYPKRVRIEGTIDGVGCKVFDADTGKIMAYVQAFSMSLGIDDEMPEANFAAIRPGPPGSGYFAVDENNELIEDNFTAEIVAINLVKKAS